MDDFQLMRGQRIIQFLDYGIDRIDETTWHQLELNTLKFKPSSTKRQHAVDPIRITQMKFVAMPRVGRITIRAEAASKKLYKPVIILHDVVFQKAKTSENISFIAANGKMYNVVPVNLQQTHVQVKCNCLDFKWRFAMYNFKDQSLMNKPPRPYKKKTNRAPNNPQRVPGLCKHLLKTAIVIVDSGLAHK
jgi:hypothetical protein